MKTKLLFYCLFFIGFCSMSGQTEAEINELLSRLEVNHMGSITDVFTLEELTTLQNYLSEGSTPQVTSLGGGKNVFAPENVNGNFGNFDLDLPDVFNILGLSGASAFEGAGGFDPATNTLVSIDNDGAAYLVEASTGMYEFIGNLTPPAGESITGVEYDFDTDQFFAISTDGSGNSTLSIVDIDSLTLTPIGDTELILAIALAFDLFGQAYVYDIDDDIMYAVNKTTGAATPIGPIGFDANFGQGMFLCPTSGNIYMTAFNNTTARSELRMVDTATGNTTLAGVIGASSPGGTLQFGWSSTLDYDLGIGENEYAKFEVYPNPASSYLTIINTEGVLIESLKIYDITGRLIKTLQIEGTIETETNFDIAHLDAGNYIVVIASNETQTTKRFIKN